MINRVVLRGLLVAVLALLALPAMGVAAEKIAVLSVQDVMDKAKVAVAAKGKIEAELNKHRAELQKEQKELEALREEIEKKRSVWSEQVKNEKERDFQRRYRDFEARNEDAKLAVQQLEKTEMEPILNKLNEIIEQIGKEEGYTLILEYTLKGLHSRTGLLYADGALDISDKVREELDKRMK